MERVEPKIRSLFIDNSSPVCAGLKGKYKTDLLIMKFYTDLQGKFPQISSATVETRFPCVCVCVCMCVCV
jgi:hypothetical protein